MVDMLIHGFQKPGTNMDWLWYASAGTKSSARVYGVNRNRTHTHTQTFTHTQTHKHTETHTAHTYAHTVSAWRVVGARDNARAGRRPQWHQSVCHVSIHPVLSTPSTTGMSRCVVMCLSEWMMCLSQVWSCNLQGTLSFQLCLFIF